jgi:hypothetical protein
MLAACTVLALIVNAGALGLAVEASHGSAVGVQSGAARSASMILVAAHDEPAVAVSSRGTAAPTIAETPPRQRPLAAPAPVARTARRTTAPPSAAPQPVIFYGFHDVDQPAFPIDDWNLDIDTLDRAGMQRLAFEVLVSDQGTVVGCTVLEPAELPDDLKRELERRIAETHLLPAERAGQFVASSRRIELSVVSTPLDLAAAAAAVRQP